MKHRIIFAGDGRNAVKALNKIRTRDDVGIVGLCVHKSDIARNFAELRALAPEAIIFENGAINTAEGRKGLADLATGHFISFNYAVILSPATIAILPPNRIVNIHTGLLPEQRGRYPNFWAILTGEPGGVTLHQISQGVDEGAIHARRKVPTDWTDTAESLYERLQTEALQLLDDNLNDILSGSLPASPQTGDYPTRRRSDFLAQRGFDLDTPTTARELLNRLRAFAFTGDSGATFQDGGRTYDVSIRIQEIDPTLPQEK